MVIFSKPKGVLEQRKFGKHCCKQSDLFGYENNLLHLAGFESGLVGLPVMKQSLQRMRSRMQKLRDAGTDCTVRSTLILFEGVPGLGAFL